MDDSIRSDQAVSKSGFPMVDMGYNGDISNLLRFSEKSVDHFIPGFLAKHLLKYFITSPMQKVKERIK